jgi:DNA-directed RNA polymerase subunit RPC12/RpoP
MTDERKYKIGDQVRDEDGHLGRVVIVWDDGDICSIENDAAHPNPKLSLKTPLVCPECGSSRIEKRSEEHLLCIDCGLKFGYKGNADKP